MFPKSVLHKKCKPPRAKNRKLLYEATTKNCERHSLLIFEILILV